MTIDVTPQKLSSSALLAVRIQAGKREERRTNQPHSQMVANLGMSCAAAGDELSLEYLQ
jgi:hypothetical protein